LYNTQFADMKAFKAANPGCILEDFIRWHSPRDLEADCIGGWKLSSRMTQSQNLWQQLWSRARPIPASLQRPLFNAEREGEKALHWLENLQPRQVLQHLLPTFLSVAYESLLPAMPASEVCPELADNRLLVDSFKQLGSALLSFDPCVNAADQTVLDQLSISARSVLDSFRRTESLVACAMSVQSKLGDLVPGLIEPLLASMFAVDPCDPGGLSGGVLIVDSADRTALSGHFTSGADGGGGEFPYPSAREYIMQTIRQTDCVKSSLLRAYDGDAVPVEMSNEEVEEEEEEARQRFSVSRIYAHLRDGEFRLVETHTRDLLIE
jgi:hypothetical protein